MLLHNVIFSSGQRNGLVDRVAQDEHERGDGEDRAEEGPVMDRLVREHKVESLSVYVNRQQAFLASLDFRELLLLVVVTISEHS